MSSNCVVVRISDGSEQWRKLRVSLERTNLDGCTEWSRNICRDGRGVDLVPLGHYIYDMCLVEGPVNISPSPTG